MKAVLQRVSSGSVKNTATDEVRAIGKGLAVLLGFSKTDTEDKIEYMVEKILNLRVFPGGENNSDFSLSVRDKNYEVLLVPQFTLYGLTKKGRRPDFAEAADSDSASSLFEKFSEVISKRIKMQQGWFGAAQEVNIVNEGPVTLIVEK
ncbi:MAG: D-aminoacyl-tRNA deacylase [bacterium]